MIRILIKILLLTFILSALLSRLLYSIWFNAEDHGFEGDQATRIVQFFGNIWLHFLLTLSSVPLFLLLKLGSIKTGSGGYCVIWWFSYRRIDLDSCGGQELG